MAKTARNNTTRKPAEPVRELLVPDYGEWLANLKSRISSARERATVAVNQELVRLYHQIGTEILERQKRQGWGTKVIDRLAADLREAFPEMKGFSSSNLKYMRFFAEKCPAGAIGQQPADQLPWFHLVTLLTKVSADNEREWYAAQVIQHGWSRPTLNVHIKNQLHRRQGVAITNFERHLPAPHAQLAIEALKTLTFSTFSASAMKPWSATSRTHSSGTSRDFSWSSATASPLLGVNSGWRWTATNSSSTCSSITRV